MHKRVRDALINGGLLCGSVIFLIGAAEIGLRATGIEAGHVVPLPLYQASKNPRISYELKPNMKVHALRSTITTNSLGIRSSEPNGKPTVAVLGDSITFGYGVEDDQTLPAHLQQLLPQYYVANGGVPGYNLEQEHGLYTEKLKALDPQLLILVFYWNDLVDMEPAVLAADGNLRPKGEVVPVSTCAPITTGLFGWIPGKCWLDTHSAVYRVLKKIAIARQGRADQAEQRTELAHDPSYEYVSSGSVLRYQQELDTLVADLPPSLPRLFVIWPESPLHTALRPQIRAMAEQRGFTVVDLYDTFGNAAETLSWDTVHPSAKTIETAAGVIRQTLQTHRLLP